MDTRTFTAVCERAGRWWTIRVPQVEGLTAQVRSLDQAEIIARRSIARALGVPPGTIRVDVHPEAPAPVAQALRARQAARLAVAAADQATLDALGALAREGYAFRDAVTMLALSSGEIGYYGPVPPGILAPVAADGPGQPPADASPLQLSRP